MSERRHSPGRSMETASHWHRWQMGDLERDVPTTRPQSDPEPERRRRQQQADERARRAAAEEARRNGFEAGHAEGHEKGYQAGYAEGLAAANAVAELEFRKRLDLSLTPIADMAANFRCALASLDDEVADQLVELALIAGRQLAGESLAAKPDHILNVVRELLDADANLSGKAKLWLHPEDLALVTSTIGDELAAAGWECHPDATLERGGCRATSASGGLDASLSTQWKAILDQRRRRGPSSDEPASDAGDD
ncbi:flagellar assembly protein FliH [Salinicola peritrichatus]|uniref:flagellar assembly protein FliH n=1 Tax=Salinicola peritrichatus TaxID=1267424 RepID=UPI000DA1E0C3|nr:flagellar assembly protein FliH [Salinicola peritrichatus]